MMVSRRSLLKGVGATAAMACVASPVHGQHARLLNDPATWRTGMFKVANADFDEYMSHPTTEERQTIANYFQRMLVYDPYFDSRTSWYPPGLVYVNAYALYADDDAAVIKA